MRALGAWIERRVLGWREPYDPKGVTLDKLKRLSDDGIEALIAAVYARGLLAVIVLEIKNNWPRNTRARKFCHGKFSP